MEGGGEADDGGGGEADNGGGAVAKSIKVTKAERSDAVNINIRRSDGTNFSVQVNRRWSVELFRSMLAQRCDIPAEKLRLVCRGRVLDDERVLSDYGLVEGTTVHLFGGFIPAATSNHTSNTVEEETTVQSGGSSRGTSDMSGIAEFKRIHRRLFQNPNLMPETIYRLMTNPNSLWFRMLSTPQIRVEFEGNPMFGFVVQNTVIFRVMAEAVIYFQLIREMVRYNDRTGGAPTLPGNQEVVRMLESNFPSDSNTRRNQFMHNPTAMMIQIFLLVHRLLSLQIPETPLNPQIREIMQNPFFFDQLKIIEVTQRILASMQSFVYQRGQQPSTSTGAGQIAIRTGGVGYETFGLDKVMNMFSELTVTPTNSNHGNVLGPEELYARQLAQLREAGFLNARANLAALIESEGDLSAAIDLLVLVFGRAPQ